MFAKWIEEYKKLWKKAEFVSKLSSFVIAVFTLLSLYDIVRFFYFVEPEKLNWNYVQELELIPPIIFQVFILLIFTTRFIFLLLRNSNVFFVSQLLGLIGLSVFFIYWYYSIPEPSTVSFEIYSTHPAPVFKHSTQFFSSIGILYLIFSPIRQIVTFIIALIKSR